MKNIYILISIYNDWESLKLLLKKINEEVKKTNNCKFNCLILNDASTIPMPEIKKPNNINSLEIINMKKNKGHARCNAFGIKYLSKKNDYDHLVIMDGDGEDQPEELVTLVNTAIENKDKSVVAVRIKRSEGFIFKSMYEIHKFLTYLFTGRLIKFGNFSCLTKENVKHLSEDKSLWSSYSGTLKKNFPNSLEVDSIRGKRYFGPSKMSFSNLLKHSLSIISVFRKTVLIRSALFIIFYILMIKSNASIITALPLILLLIMIYSISSLALRENMDEFDKALSKIVNIEKLK